MLFSNRNFAANQAAGFAGCHKRDVVSFSYPLPLGKLTNSNCIPHGERK